MNRKRSVWVKRAFGIAFLVLTSLCWCPWAYGTAEGRMFGIPTWAVLAYVFAAVLFLLEWVFLFRTGLAVSDEDLPRIVAELEAVQPDNRDSATEDE